MSYVVGLTGGIGSGKSTVAQCFRVLGAPIIDADVIARSLVTKGQPAYHEIIHQFGPKILTQTSEINRPLLRELIFNHPEHKKWLEALLHPAIYRIIIQEISKVDYPYCIVVLPLLTEQYPLYQSMIDHVLVIDTSQENQTAWTVKRDNSNADLVIKMIQSQVSREDRLKIADTVIPNDSNLATLENKIKNLHQVFLNKS
jgi:dephospho-CoA kinase